MANYKDINSALIHGGIYGDKQTARCVAETYGELFISILTVNYIT